MGSAGIVALISDGVDYWTEMYHSRSAQGTFICQVDSRRYGSSAEAIAGSSWWPRGEAGVVALTNLAQLHRSMCSQRPCAHRILRVLEVAEAPLPPRSREVCRA
jgi:hypothetical protein